MKAPLFSILIATYNRNDYLGEAVASVLRQTVNDFECIVVDDASPQPAPQFEDSRIRTVRRRVNGGAAASWNTGLEIARGKYVLWLGDDDVYTPDRLALALQGLAISPVSLCWSAFIGEESSTKGRVLDGHVLDTIAEGTLPSLGATAARLDVVPKFDEAFRASQDIDWWLRIAPAVRVTTVPEIGYLIRRHSGDRHGNDTEARIQASLRLMEKHAVYFQTHPSARASRWKRIGLMALSVGDRAAARYAFRSALGTEFELKTLAHLCRSLIPSGLDPLRRVD